ncbi:M20/M25/M40 family metallo-hydrolase [Streptomyces mexicanus]|uniref:M20/M25/M40 family metallo-hydrolase n=1 Tax=Streptomyces mexicanus TaxID=178566 RepID=UPI00367AB859
MSALFTGRYQELLLDLLGLPSVNPLEAGEDDPPSRLPDVLERYAAAAAESGLRTVRLAAAPAACLARPGVPVTVRAAARDPRFLADQPSLLLRLGPERPRADTMMFNVHLDTVAGHAPPAFDGRTFTGRGAVDAKGPAVALLAGLRAAAAHPAVGRDVTVLLQAVAGEEGGALGTYGTRPLLEAGHHGRLNVFCEPTGLRALPWATASMTARITVTGEDAVDDRPDAGHNATVLLGFLAQHLAAHLDGAVPGARVCLAGLHTGHTHNRVHGTGTLLANLSYRTTADGGHLKDALTRHVTEGLARFTELFAGAGEFARTARDASRITRLTWDKHGLPALDNRDPWAEALLTRAGARPAGDAPGFTCDAVWAAGLDDAFTAVLGPGDLAANRAHAPGEFVHLADLEDFARVVHRLVTLFADDHRPASRTRNPG